VLNDKGLQGNEKLVPYAFFGEQPTPPMPKA